MDAVDDGVYAGVKRVDHTLGRRAVGRGVLAELVRLLADSGQLVHVEGRAQRVAGARAAAGGGYLDEVGSLLDQLARGGSALDGAGRLDAEVAEVSADDGDGTPGQQQPGRR